MDLHVEYWPWPYDADMCMKDGHCCAFKGVIWTQSYMEMGKNGGDGMLCNAKVCDHTSYRWTEVST